MTNEEIDRFLARRKNLELPVKISFTSRTAFKGLFIQEHDFTDLRKKNLWRIVSESYLERYSEKKDPTLARIFNGQEITRLELIPG